jgi:hypothetical protein
MGDELAFLYRSFTFANGDENRHFLCNAIERDTIGQFSDVPDH